ncbi:hypothetical protein A2335_03910 [Candidatus Peregrinibacteria bacterium RIFOXYB2_FULL_32_7]|nr:MAG: hypothetical protein A2335_03910 [Candidatus Peregrinibacteria bacterium RIFOXYB2_FULL_32_7]
MKTKIFSLLLLAILLLSSCNETKNNPETSVMIVPSFNNLENPANFETYFNNILFTYQTNKIDKVIFSGSYENLNSTVSRAKSLADKLGGLGVEPKLEECALIDYQSYEAVARMITTENVSKIYITAETSNYEKALIESFIAFQANKKQKKEIKEEVIKALASSIDNRDFILNGLRDKVKTWQKDISKLKIGIQRTAFPALTDAERKTERLANTFIEILAQLDDEKEQELINTKLSEIAGEKGDIETAKEFLKGCF